MKLSRRRFLQATAGASAPSTFSRPALAQTYPTRPIRLVVGFPPGGSADVIARMIGQPLSDRLRQPVVIENRPGAGSNIATAMVIQAPPDGYTLLAVSSANSWNTALYENLKFDFLKQIQPVAGVDRGFGVLVVQPSFPANTIEEFIAYARANPGKMRMASGGVGSAQHLWGTLFKRMTGIDVLHVPYRGGGPALNDLLGGHVQMMIDTMVTSVGHIRSGELRALGVTTVKRSGALPDVPAIGEVVPGFEAIGWQGIGAPPDTPAEIVNRLNKEVNLALVDPSFRQRIYDLGVETFPTSPLEFRRFIADFTEKWAKLIRDENIKAE